MRKEAPVAAFAILAGIAGLLQFSLAQMVIMISETHRAQQRKAIMARVNLFSFNTVHIERKKTKITKKKKFWTRPERTSKWWENFEN